MESYMLLTGMSKDMRPPRLWMPRNKHLSVGVAVLFWLRLFR